VNSTGTGKSRSGVANPPVNTASKKASKPRSTVRKLVMVPKSDSVTVFYATNRDTLDDAFATKAPADAQRLSLGHVAVELLGDPLLTDSSRDLIAPPELNGMDNFQDPERGSCAQLLDRWLATAADQDAAAVLFIHGFSNTFGSAVRRAAQIVEFYSGAEFRMVPLTFSWPSDGRAILPASGINLLKGSIDQYKIDQNDATAAGPALARLLSAIRRARARQRPEQASPRHSHCLLPQWATTLSRTGFWRSTTA
jgi:esterase/lipase superfamily enzyme